MRRDARIVFVQPNATLEEQQVSVNAKLRVVRRVGANPRDELLEFGVIVQGSSNVVHEIKVGYG